MLHDPAKSLIWTQSEIADGALDRAAAQDIKTMFATFANRANSGQTV